MRDKLVLLHCAAGSAEPQSSRIGHNNTAACHHVDIIVSPQLQSTSESEIRITTCNYSNCILTLPLRECSICCVLTLISLHCVTTPSVNRGTVVRPVNPSEV